MMMVMMTMMFIFAAFGRRPCPEGLLKNIYLIYTTEHLVVKGLPQGPSSGGLVELGIEPTVFRLIVQHLNHEPPLPHLHDVDDDDGKDVDDDDGDGDDVIVCITCSIFVFEESGNNVYLATRC
ncbi:MAG: hypothetical protein ACRC4N_02085 [Gammaproteobacteria bacterium]